MTNIKVARIWGIYFLCGFLISQVHFLRYLNSFLTNYVPWSLNHIDYGFVSNQGIVIRVLCFVFSLFLLRIRTYKPVTATTLIWTLDFIILSNEHDKYTFLPIFIICLSCFVSCVYLFQKNNKLSD